MLRRASINTSPSFRSSCTVRRHRASQLTLTVSPVNARGRFKPDPELDAIHAIFYSVQREVDEPCVSGFIALTNDLGDPCARVPKLGLDKGQYEVTFVDEESELFRELIDTVLRFDPDVLTGFEVQLNSWGYLIERYIHVMGALADLQALSVRS